VNYAFDVALATQRNVAQIFGYKLTEIVDFAVHKGPRLVVAAPKRLLPSGGINYCEPSKHCRSVVSIYYGL
jgi:hypothetical protein